MAIKFKGSETPGSTPTVVTDINERELAWNLVDKKIFSVDSGNNLISFSGTDEKVKVSVTDTAAGYLEDKLLGGDGIYFDTSVGNEQITVNADIFLATLDGNLIPFYIDTNRSKTLSVEISTPMFAKSSVSNNAWISIGNASDADTGYIMPFNGTLVGVQGFTESAKDCDIALYKNTAVESASIIAFTGSGNQQVNSNLVNIDFVKGDKIRLRATNISGFGGLGDTNIELRIKWRV